MPLSKLNSEQIMGRDSSNGKGKYENVYSKQSNHFAHKSISFKKNNYYISIVMIK